MSDWLAVLSALLPLQLAVLQLLAKESCIWQSIYLESNGFSQTLWSKLNIFFLCLLPAAYRPRLTSQKLVYLAPQRKCKHVLPTVVAVDPHFRYSARVPP
jgi:hypothetical protein